MDNVFPPKRIERTVNDDGTATQRATQYFEEVARVIRSLPDQGAAVADLPGGGTLADSENKINELLASLRAANIIDT